MYIEKIFVSLVRTLLALPIEKLLRIFWQCFWCCLKCSICLKWSFGSNSMLSCLISFALIERFYLRYSQPVSRSVFTPLTHFFKKTMWQYLQIPVIWKGISMVMILPNTNCINDCVYIFRPYMIFNIWIVWSAILFNYFILNQVIAFRKLSLAPSGKGKRFFIFQPQNFDCDKSSGHQNNWKMFIRFL